MSLENKLIDADDHDMSFRYGPEQVPHPAFRDAFPYRNNYRMWYHVDVTMLGGRYSQHFDNSERWLIHLMADNFRQETLPLLRTLAQLKLPDAGLWIVDPEEDEMGSRGRWMNYFCRNNFWVRLGLRFITHVKTPPYNKYIKEMPRNVFFWVPVHKGMEGTIEHAAVILSWYAAQDFGV